MQPVKLIYVLRQWLGRQECAKTSTKITDYLNCILQTWCHFLPFLAMIIRLKIEVNSISGYHLTKVEAKVKCFYQKSI